MEYIAREAGIGKGTIYEYFASKEQLIEEMYQFSIEEYRQGLKRSMEQGEDIREKLEAISQYNIDFIRSHLDMLLMFMQGSTFPKEARLKMLDEHAVILQLYRELVHQAQERGELRPGLDEDLATCMIIGSIDQYVKLMVISKTGPEAQTKCRSLVDMLLQGLK